MIITEKQALRFIKEYKDLCIKHKIRIGMNMQEERYDLFNIDKRDEIYFLDQLNEALEHFSDKKAKQIHKLQLPMIGITAEPIKEEQKCTCAISGKQKCPIHKVCIKCGHQVCPHCGDWCDTMLYKKEDKGNHCEQTGFTLVIGGNMDDDYPMACCDGKCIYE